MQTKPLFLVAAVATFFATTAFAQAQSAPMQDAAPTTAPAPAPDANAPADQQPQPAPQAAVTAPAPADHADLKAKANVYDPTGAKVGTIVSVTTGGAVVSTGTARAEIPVASFAKNAQGLVIGMTKSQLEAAVAKATPAKS